jgi:F-type H+-transporting ATPase subunit gamma
VQNTRDIRRRINSVRSTQQITKAMEMVAAAKLRRAQASVVASRPYVNKMAETISRIVARGVDISHTLLESQPGGPAYLVISADRGLCGAYNANVLRFAREKIAAEPGPVAVVGRKARDFMTRRQQDVIAQLSLMEAEPCYEDASNIAEPLLNYFEQGVFGSLHLIYTDFISPLQNRPRMVQLLPVAGFEPASVPGQALYLYEPSPEEVLASLLPRYVRSLIYHGLLESKASEHGARMTAMKSATDNAADMIDKLTLSFNQARQAAITLEILEVVNGAQALEG